MHVHTCMFNKPMIAECSVISSDFPPSSFKLIVFCLLLLKVMISAKDQPESQISPAMDGLLRIHKRIIDGLDGEARAPQNAGNGSVTRLLAGSTQTGTLIGKHGSTIKSIQDASNCIIRVTGMSLTLFCHDLDFDSYGSYFYFYCSPSLNKTCAYFLLVLYAFDKRGIHLFQMSINII